MAELRLENIGKNFGKAIALKEISLKIKDGTFCVILGPSGCGKSTLLNVIAGLEEPTQGKIYLGDKDITELTPHKRNMAMVFQSYALYPHLTAFENIAFGLRAKGEKKKIIQEKVKEASRILNIEDKIAKFPRQLSGGERQRVATGRAMVREPELFLFDEPLSNLDARLRLELRAEFIKLHQRLKKTIIYVTHDQIEAMSLGEEVVVLKEGAIMQVSGPRQLYDNPVNLFVAEFIGTPPMNILRLRLDKSADRLRLTKGNFSLELPAEFMPTLGPYLGQDIYLGFRPAAIGLDDLGPLKAEVIFTEVIGEDSFARISIAAGIELNVKIPGQTQLVPGERIAIKIDPAKFYFFTANKERINILRQFPS
jgi:multiple sugar transport system ATP-binding protein